MRCREKGASGEEREDCGGACVEDFCITIVFLPDCLREPGLGTMTQPALLLLVWRREEA